MPKSDGGPAFPGMWQNDGDLNATAPDGQIVPPDGVAHIQGMSLRDWFAGQALAGATAGLISPRAYASLAYEIADAMLAARSRVDSPR